MKQILFLTALLVLAAGAYAQSSQWVAFNDHYRGPNTGPNVSSWNINNTTGGAPGNGGPLTNVASGVQLTASLLVSNAVTGFTGGTAAGGPNPGTPAALAFTNFIDWGSGTLNHAIQLASSARIAHIFSGLDPARRYSWRGSAVRANNYTDRWTLVEVAAAGSTPNHASAVVNTYFTTADIGSLASTQVVCNFGENRAAGMLAGWDNIQPNPDGTIIIYMSTYRSTMPAGFSSGGTYGYAIQADRLEEFSSSPDTCVGITSESGNISVPERGLATFSISATGTPQTIRWFRSNDGGANYSQIAGASSSTYSIPSVVVGDNGAKFYASVSNSVCSSNSTVKTLTVVADTTRPTALRAVLNTNRTTITINFSEPIDPGIDPSSFTVFPTGTNPDDGTLANSATVVNGTNIVVIVPAGAVTPGVSFSISILDVNDTAATPNLIFPYPTILPLQQSLIVFAFDKTWRYDQSGTDLGTAWKETFYNDSAWPSGPGVLGFETTAATLTFLTSIAPPTGTNTVLTLTNNTGAGIGGTNVTFYFRTTVNIPDFNPALATMTLRGYFDDGAALYINGVEQFRYNLITNANYTRFAAANLTEAVLTVSNLTGFVQGNNVIAVEVHQDAIGSSDIDFGMQLEGLVSTFAPAGPTLTPSLSGNTLTISWNGGGTFQRSSNLSSPANWVTIPGASSPFVTNTTGGPLFFRVVVP